jgi:taurine dioxygenase
MKGVDLNHSLDNRTFATIHQAFLDHCMLVFRGQFLEPETQKAFTDRWGGSTPLALFEATGNARSSGCDSAAQPGQS